MFILMNCLYSLKNEQIMRANGLSYHELIEFK